MKIFLSCASLLASATAVCYSQSSCEAEVRCEVVFQASSAPIYCFFPNIRQACCNVVQVMMACNSDAQCVRNQANQWPSAELQWVQSNHGADDCPGLQALDADMEGNMQQFCHDAGVEDLEEIKLSLHEMVTVGQFAIMTAQQPELAPDIKTAFWPGMLGFAIGAAVVTSVVTMKKTRNAKDYISLTEEVA